MAIHIQPQIRGAREDISTLGRFRKRRAQLQQKREVIANEKGGSMGRFDGYTNLITRLRQ